MQIRILTTLSLLTLILACSPVISSSVKSSNTILNYKMKEAFRAWENTPIEDSYDFYEKNYTYINTGLRYNYALLKNLASIGILEKASGEKVFLSGPHGAALDFQSSDSFGYYNPAFLKKVKTVIAYSLENDNTFKQLGKFVYDNRLKKVFQLYKESYIYLKKNDEMTMEITKSYQNEILNNKDAGKFIQDSFRPFANKKEQLGEDWYIANTAPGFWIRRKIDGTADEIFEILELVSNAYE